MTIFYGEYMKSAVKYGFTLVELMVVIAVIALLTTILLPGLARARLQAKIVAVNADLRQIGLALEMYCLDHKEYPPTRQDCHTGTLKDHLYQLPKQLPQGGYLPATGPHEVTATIMEDRFHRGHTYKYRSVGECIMDRDMIDRWIPAKLWVPDGFPVLCTSLNAENGKWYDNPEDCPVSWVLFSVGPEFDEQWVMDNLSGLYPVPQQTWYHPSRKKGFLVRIHTVSGNEYGSFERTP